MSAGEYRKICSGCRKRGDKMFARIYPQPINDEWVWLCSSCWEMQAVGRHRPEKNMVKNNLLGQPTISDIVTFFCDPCNAILCAGCPVNDILQTEKASQPREQANVLELCDNNHHYIKGNDPAICSCGKRVRR